MPGAQWMFPSLCLMIWQRIESVYHCVNISSLESLQETSKCVSLSEVDRKKKSKGITWAYLMVDVLVVFDGWALGVVAGGRWGRRETTEQATGVLLLAIYELLHEAFPGVHEHASHQDSGAGFHQPINVKNAGYRGARSKCDNVCCTLCFLWVVTDFSCAEAQITASVTGKLIRAAADRQMGCKTGYLRERGTQLSIN